MSINQTVGNEKLASVWGEGCDMIKSVIRKKYSCLIQEGSHPMDKKTTDLSKKEEGPNPG